MSEPSLSFFEELKRRNVFRVGLAYVVTAWILAQVADLAMDNFGAPEWVMKSLLFILLMGFPLALLFAWAFEKTPEGLKLEKNVDRSRSITAVTGKKMDRGIIIALAIAVVFLLADKFMFQEPRESIGADSQQQAASPATGSESSEKSASVSITGDRAAGAPAGATSDKSIAVLPFVNMSSDPEQDYFANGMQEDILTYLSRVAELRVTSRTSVLKYAGSKQEDVRAIAAELGVNYILEGSVRKSGNRVRVTAQLIDARDDEHVWADNFDRDMDDVFAIQTEVAQAIVTALQASLSPVEAARISARPTTSVVAYEMYLRARDIMNRSGYSLEKFQEAEPLTKAAIQEDPEFALAHLQLAEIYGQYYWLGERSPQRRESIRLEMDEAARIAPQLPEVKLALGEYYYRVMRDFPRALEAFDNVRAQLPNDADVQTKRANALRRLGRWDESIDAYRAAWTMDPLNKDASYNLQLTLDRARRWKESLAMAEQQMDTGNADPRVEFQWAMTRLRYLGDFQSARDVLARVPAVNDNSYYVLRAYVPWIQRDFKTVLEVYDNDPMFIAAGKEPAWAIFFEQAGGEAWLMAGDAEQARYHFEAGIRAVEAAERQYMDGDSFVESSKSLAQVRLGRREAAVESMSRALRLAPESKDHMNGVYVRQRNAILLTVLGEKQKALDELEYQLQVPNGWTEWELYLDPTWDPLRDEPRFKAMVAGVSKQAKEAAQ
jgi:TolB-like protein